MVVDAGSDRRTAVRGAGALAAATVFGRFLALASSLVLARILIPEEIGVFTFALAAVSLAAQLANFEARRDIIRNPRESVRRARAYAGISAQIGFAVGALFLGFGHRLADVLHRPESGQFLCGRSPQPNEEPEVGNFEVDYEFFESHVWPVLAHRVKAFEAIKLANAWAGYYAYNTFDQNAILGPHPEMTNFYFANGFSGHGLQQSPAVGRAIAEHMVHGAFTSLDLSRFGYERVARGEPIFEKNVV